MKKIIAAAFLATSVHAVAQSNSEDQISNNKGAYNKLEFFINSQMTDSVYQLGNDSFKKQIGLAQLRTVLDNDIYPKGRIHNSETVDFKNGISTFRIDVGDVSYDLLFGVDSTLHYHTLLFKPSKKAIPETKQTDSISPAVAVSSGNFLVDSIANTYLQQPSTASLAIGIIQDGKPQSYLYGKVAKDGGNVPTAQTPYEIGSITKVFTAIVLANLVEEGTVTLDQPISLFLPDSLKSNTILSQITFKMLANHTSGLPRLPENLEKIKGYTPADPYKTYDKKALYSYLAAYNSTKTPGEVYAYSNLGYAVLGSILSDIYKKPYNQIVQEIICKPLSLHNTSELLDAAKNHGLKNYNIKGEQVPSWNFIAFSAAGGLKSTVDDLLTFITAQFKMPQTVLENAMANTRQFTFFLPPDTDIGLAWHMSMIDDLTVYWHNGGTGGSSSYLAFSPDKKTGVVLLSNAGASVDELGKTLLDSLIKLK